jgi:hypothetical protein
MYYPRFVSLVLQRFNDVLIVTSSVLAKYCDDMNVDTSIEKEATKFWFLKYESYNNREDTMGFLYIIPSDDVCAISVLATPH